MQFGSRLTELLRLKDLLGLSLEELKGLDTARQLELVRRRREEIAQLETQLVARRKRVKALLRELEREPA